MSEEYNKQNLLKKIAAARKELEHTLAQVSDQQMLLTILHGEWSVKDLLGHLGFWESTTVVRFHLLRDRKMPEPVPDMDALNARVLAESRLLSLNEVRSQEQESYRRLLAMVDIASHDELFKPGYFAWAKEEPFVSWIAGNTWEHYEEHLPELKAWLKRVA